MNGNEEQDAARTAPRRRRIASMALVTSGFMAGAVLAGTQIAGANDATSSGSTSSATAWFDAEMDPATMRHGPDETLLKGDTADRVEEAALAEVPDGTIIRVETDSDGAAYEAHIETDDGIVTLKLDEDFNVTDAESGFAGGMSHDDRWDGSND
jgi:hypothetical protein